MSRRRTSLDFDSASDRGMALAIVMGALLLSLAVTSALVLTGATEVRIAMTTRDDRLLASAARAMAVRTLVDLRAADWDAVLAGGVSTFVDGPPVGARQLPGGVEVDLDAETFDASCGRPDGCSEAEVTAVSETRPWGARNPRWRLYAYGSLAALVPGDPSPPSVYVVAWVADDPADADGDPFRDGASVDDPGHHVVMVLARAYGPRGTRRSVQSVVERVGADLRLLAQLPGSP